MNKIEQPSMAASSEEDDLVDSFINMDGYENYYGDKDDNHDDNINQAGGESRLGFEHDNNFRGGGEEEEEEEEEAIGMNYGDGGGGGGVDGGLQLVHSLLACAEAVGCRDIRLADSMLGRLWRSANCYGDSLQRVSYWFTMGLKSRLSNIQSLNPKGVFNQGGMSVSSEKMEAFHLLHQATPYIAFGFMAANDAIVRAGKGKGNGNGNDSIHIIDLGMEHCLQWPPLIRTLAQQPEGPPKKVRITGLVKSGVTGLEPAMKELAEYAAAMGVPLELNIVPEPELDPAAAPGFPTSLDVREGEALFVNSIMHLHGYVKESRGSLTAVLRAVKNLRPTLVTVVEKDANHNGPFFLGRFLESLHYYSAIFDSLEACLPRNSLQRMKIERGYFGEEIRNIVAYEGSERMERHERAEQWRRQIRRAGFQAVGMKTMSQARMMLSVYGCDGYSLGSEKGCLLLGWKGKPVMMASAWQLPGPSSSSSS